MAKKKKNKTKRDAQWAEAKRLCRLNVETIRMAKSLSMNPRTLIKNRPSPTQQWKAPVHLWIRDLYEKSQEKSARKRARREREQQANNDGGVSDNIPASDDIPIDGPPRGQDVPGRHAVDFDEQSSLRGPDDVFDDEFGFGGFRDADQDDPDSSRPLSQKMVDVQIESLLRRQRDFHMVAERVAEALSEIPTVCQVALLGSVADHLEYEVPRFPEYRRDNTELRHGCGEIDLAVWLDELRDLKRLQEARRRAVNDVLRDKNIRVHQQQVEIFLLEPITNRYRGRLCCFGQCPNADKPECWVAGCGVVPYLQQLEGFRLYHDALYPDRVVILYDREYELSQMSQLSQMNPEPDPRDVPF